MSQNQHGSRVDAAGHPHRENRWRVAMRLALSLLFIAAGILHFVRPAFYVQIVPPFLPWPLALVYISGACEILGGCALLAAQTRRLAGYGLIALLVAVFPANIQMLMQPE